MGQRAAPQSFPCPSHRGWKDGEETRRLVKVFPPPSRGRGMVERVIAVPLAVLPWTMAGQAGSGHSPARIDTATGEITLSC